MGQERSTSSILWARPCEKPSFIPTSRPRGSKAAGLRYERNLAQFLQPGVIHGQWFEYEDATGIHYCQPDILYPISRWLISIIEVKYTLVEGAFDQLVRYLPVVEAAYNMRAALVVAFKNFGPSIGGGPFTDLLEASYYSVEHGEDTVVTLLHWVGQPILPQPNRRTSGILDLLKDRKQSSYPSRVVPPQPPGAP